MTDPEQQYREAIKPNAIDLIGTWKVTVLSGRLPNMRWLGHVKVIKVHNGKLRGYNRTLGIRWGRFTIGFCEDCAMFVYGKVAFFDKVRKVDDKLLIGQYKLRCGNGELATGGYFKMRRKD